MSRPDHEASIKLLRENPVFAGSTDEQLHTLLDGAELIELGNSSEIFAKGDSADAVYVVCEGLVRVYHQGSNDRQTTVTHLMPPSTFGETEVFAESVGHIDSGYLTHTQTMKPSVLLKVRADAFLQYVQRDTSAAQEMLRDISGRFCDAVMRERDIFFEVPVRLASLLLTFAEMAGRETPKGIQIRLSLNNQDLAHGLGVAVKSISRTLSDWKKRDWVIREKGWFIIQDFAALEECCRGARFNLSYRYAPQVKAD